MAAVSKTTARQKTSVSTDKPLENLLDQLIRAFHRSGTWYLHIEPDSHPKPELSWTAIIRTAMTTLHWENSNARNFLRAHAKRMTPWQRDAFRALHRFPDRQLRLDTMKESWQISRAGVDAVVFSLPLAEHGGDRAWVTNNGHTMYQIRRHPVTKIRVRSITKRSITKRR